MEGYLQYSRGSLTRVGKGTVQEAPLTINLNSRELVRLLCTPEKLTSLVVGYLYLEGMIENLSEITFLNVCPQDGMAEVRLSKEPVFPKRRVVTSGCGGGITFNIDFEAEAIPNSNPLIYPDQLFKLMRELFSLAHHYHETRGIHISGLSDGNAILIAAEDIGRHNTLDKLMGEALMRRLPTEGMIILTSGRISSEMLLKAAKMRVPLIASRTSPTGLALELAEGLGMTVVGYLRGEGFNIYTHPGRIIL